MSMREKIVGVLRENTEVRNIGALADELEKALNEAYTVGDRTMAHVFKAAGLTNVSNMQAVFDQVEKSLEILETEKWRLPTGFKRVEIEEMLSIVQEEPQTVDGGGEFGPTESTDGWYTRLLKAIMKDAPEKECMHRMRRPSG